MGLPGRIRSVCVIAGVREVTESAHMQPIEPSDGPMIRPPLRLQSLLMGRGSEIFRDPWWKGGGIPLLHASIGGQTNECRSSAACMDAGDDKHGPSGMTDIRSGRGSKIKVLPIVTVITFSIGTSIASSMDSIRLLTITILISLLILVVRISLVLLLWAPMMRKPNGSRLDYPPAWNGSVNPRQHALNMPNVVMNHLRRKSIQNREHLLINKHQNSDENFKMEMA